MNFFSVVLIIVCVLEAWLVVDARQETRILSVTQDNFLNLNVMAIRSNIKLADKIVTQPAEALDLVNKSICGGNPFPDNFLQFDSVKEQTKYSLLALKEEVAAYCKDKAIEPIVETPKTNP